MKVRDLKAKLDEFDDDAEVLVSSSNFELNNSMVSANSARQYETGKRERKGFRDAFDGESYSKEVWDLFYGDEKIVIIS